MWTAWLSGSRPAPPVELDAEAMDVPAAADASRPAERAASTWLSRFSGPRLAVGMRGDGNSLVGVSAGTVSTSTDGTPSLRAAAAGIGERLEEAVRTNAISMADLFDEDYRPVPNTQPAQHTTRFVALADRLFPDLQEQVLAEHPKAVFCIAVDRNGYVPTHNQRYCQPQRGDLAWDTANSRYRRIFNDRTGLASARNQRPFLLQTYRRDMGGGRFVLLKEAAAPITVNGRHWGGMRLAFNF